MSGYFQATILDIISRSSLESLCLYRAAGRVSVESGEVFIALCFREIQSDLEDVASFFWRLICLKFWFELLVSGIASYRGCINGIFFFCLISPNYVLRLSVAKLKVMVHALKL